jgi:thymidine kinase
MFFPTTIEFDSLSMREILPMHVSKPPRREPQITTYYGPMFSGKTTQMISCVERFSIAGFRCVIVQYRGDTRYDHLAKQGGIITHRGDEKSQISVIRHRTLGDVPADDYDVIGVDEAQFYPDCPEVINKWVLSGKHVVTACLNTDFAGRPIGRSADVINVSDIAIKLSAVCFQCGDDAPFTHRLSADTTVEVIGGSEQYTAACRRCFNALARVE